MGHDPKVIMDIALDLFAKKGYSSVSTRELAQAAGITETTLFRKFESKINLFRLISQAATESDETLDKIRTLASDDPATGIVELMNLLHLGNLRGKKLFKMIFHSPALMDDQIRCDEIYKAMDLHEEVRQFLLRLYGADGPQGDCHLLAWQILNQVIGHFVMVEVFGLDQNTNELFADFSRRMAR